MFTHMGASRRLPVCAGARICPEKLTFSWENTFLQTWGLRTACLFALAREFFLRNALFPGKTHFTHMGASHRLPVCAGARCFPEKHTFSWEDIFLLTWELRTASLFALARVFLLGKRTFREKTHFFEKSVKRAGIWPWDPSQVVELVFLFNPAPVSARSPPGAELRAFLCLLTVYWLYSAV